MELLCVGATRVFSKWALTLCLSPAFVCRESEGQSQSQSQSVKLQRSPQETLLVAGMNGEVVELDHDLQEVGRWTAHAGAFNVLQAGRETDWTGKADASAHLIWTAGGDGCLRAWVRDECLSQAKPEGPDATEESKPGAALGDSAAVWSEALCLFGPKKPITAFWWGEAAGAFALGYERALYHWSAPEAQPRKINGVASLERLGQAWYGCPKTGAKAADIGPLAEFDPITGNFGTPVFDDGFAVWSLKPWDDRRLLAFGVDRRAWVVDPIMARRQLIEWHCESSGPGSLILSNGSRLLYGKGAIVCDGISTDAPLRGLYGAVEWPRGRVLFAGADGQVWIFAL